MKTKQLLIGVGLGIAALLLTACGANSNPLGEATSPQPSQPGQTSAASAPVVVGSADFTESKILAEIYSQALSAKGVESSTKLGIGSREIYIKALQDQSISAVPEYTGNLLLHFDPNATATTPGEVEKALPDVLPSDLKPLRSSAAVNQDVYVVTKEFSAQHDITSLEDLHKIAATSTLGGPPELEKRAYGPPGLETIYGAKFKAFVPYAKYPPKISDLDKNKIQVATFFTTDAVIAEKGYVQLEDPQSMILPQNVVPLVRSDVAENQTAVAALEAVQAALTTEELMQLDKKVDTDRQDPGQVAGEWLASKSLA
ncbi:MAG TPA: ABC transporter substrate-binding protein [Propionibacteriaceae bacterium]|jgi:osmoprotectant transport system substrate-binding protein|nr:ABC transporter substrate-binding protein [Propionibacteriaceae bacterium]